MASLLEKTELGKLFSTPPVPIESGAALSSKLEKMGSRFHGRTEPTYRPRNYIAQRGYQNHSRLNLTGCMVRWRRAKNAPLLKSLIVQDSAERGGVGSVPVDCSI